MLKLYNLKISQYINQKEYMITLMNQNTMKLYQIKNLHHHHYVCQMNTDVMIIYKHIATIISEIKKDLHDILQLTHQNLCANVHR